MYLNLEFFQISLTHEINSSGIKLSKFEQDDQVLDNIVFKSDCYNKTFFIVVHPKSFKIYVDKTARFGYDTADFICEIVFSTTTSSNVKAVAEAILDYINSHMLEDITNIGAFGFKLVGIKKLNSEIKLSFEIKDYNKNTLMRQDGQVYEKHVYYSFDKPEAELALILLNISGNGRISEMITRFIKTPNENNPHWDINNGGVFYELQHSIAWVIQNKYYKVEHLKK